MLISVDVSCNLLESFNSLRILLFAVSNCNPMQTVLLEVISSPMYLIVPRCLFMKALSPTTYVLSRCNIVMSRPQS